MEWSVVFFVFAIVMADMPRGRWSPNTNLVSESIVNELRKALFELFTAIVILSAFVGITVMVAWGYLQLCP